MNCPIKRGPPVTIVTLESAELSNTLANHGRGIVVQDFEQSLDGVVAAEISEAFDCPIANIDVVIVNRGEEDLPGPVRFNSPIAQQANIPQGIGARTLFSRAGIGFE